MHTFVRTRGLVVLAAIAALLVAAFAAVPQADAATIYTCVKKKSGTLRLVSKSTKCKKGESKLSWNTTGPAGKNGLNGLNGLNGANGATGATGLTGPNGPMGKPIAEANSEGRAECAITGENNYCYPTLAPVTLSSNAQCLVTVEGQITGLAAGTTSQQGPYFRIAINNGGENGDDGEYGFYFMGTAGSESTVLTRTQLIAVEAGKTYEFGGYYGEVQSEWAGRDAYTEASYICFA